MTRALAAAGASNTWIPASGKSHLFVFDCLFISRIVMRTSLHTCLYTSLHRHTPQTHAPAPISVKAEPESPPREVVKRAHRQAPREAPHDAALPVIPPKTRENSELHQGPPKSWRSTRAPSPGLTLPPELSCDRFSVSRALGFGFLSRGGEGVHLSPIYVPCILSLYYVFFPTPLYSSFFYIYLYFYIHTFMLIHIFSSVCT